MTPRPPTHREPTDEEMQCLPEGTLVLMTIGTWQAPAYIGRSANFPREIYAVPITKQEDATLPTPPDMPLLTWMTGQALATLRAEDFTNPTWAYDMAGQAIGIAEAVLEKLAARNNQPEKV